MFRLVLSVVVCAYCLLPVVSQAEETKAGCYDKGGDRRDRRRTEARRRRGRGGYPAAAARSATHPPQRSRATAPAASSSQARDSGDWRRCAATFRAPTRGSSRRRRCPASSSPSVTATGACLSTASEPVDTKSQSGLSFIMRYASIILVCL